MPQGARGRIKLWCDFFQEDNIANTAEHRQIGDFSVGGQGNAETDAGVPTLNADALSGVGRITTTDQIDHTTLVGTPIAFDVGLMGTLVLETRVRFLDLDTKDVFIGFADIDPNVLSVQTDIISNDGATTLTLVASDLVGFYLSAELTDDEDWHTVYNGGSATGVTASGSLDVDDDAVAGEWQILRLELSPNGTARWYIDDLQVGSTVEGAVSTSTDLAAYVAVEAKGNAIEVLDTDYLLVEANRDWTI